MPDPAQPPKPSGKKSNQAATDAASKVPLPPVRQPTARESLANKIYGTPLPKEVGLGGRRRRRRGAGLVDVSKVPLLPASPPESESDEDEPLRKLRTQKSGIGHDFLKKIIPAQAAAQAALRRKTKKRGGSRKTRRKTHRRRR
jgi:hypothetical protein